ncbi:unnamed protein product [marine sediment metagenome]|uniref:Uncharacterized protein n=1 Tax=marine sediment metagenome TaxID=412755 RepID=X1U702_9ZZZZ
MSETIRTFQVNITHTDWSIDELRKYAPCEFTYYYNQCHKLCDFSEWMFGTIIEKDGELFLAFDENDDMQDDIKVDSKLGREILAMSEM